MLLAGNGWQVGADAAPYFRIFNPILQGEKFDKDGEYVKKGADLKIYQKNIFINLGN